MAGLPGQVLKGSEQHAAPPHCSCGSCHGDYHTAYHRWCHCIEPLNAAWRQRVHPGDAPCTAAHNKLCKSIRHLSGVIICLISQWHSTAKRGKHSSAITMYVSVLQHACTKVCTVSWVFTCPLILITLAGICSAASLDASCVQQSLQMQAWPAYRRHASEARMTCPVLGDATSSSELGRGAHKALALPPQQQDHLILQHTHTLSHCNEVSMRGQEKLPGNSCRLPFHTSQQALCAQAGQESAHGLLMRICISTRDIEDHMTCQLQGAGTWLTVCDDWTSVQTSRHCMCCALE